MGIFSAYTSRCRIFFIGALSLMFAVWMFFNYLAAEPERIGEACSKEDVQVYQGPTAPMPNGIPTYTAQVLNVCEKGCPIAGIHLTCGWFSSALMIDPKIFKRLKYDDCLVNDGQTLKAGGSISFQYANTYSYPLAVASECP